MSDGIELVAWRDAHHTVDDWDVAPEDYVVRTVGWVREDGRFLRIEGERLPDDDGARSVTRIPLENVVSRTPLTGYASVSAGYPSQASTDST